MKDHLEEYYGPVNADLEKCFDKLNVKLSNQEIIDNIMKIIKIIRK